MEQPKEYRILLTAAVKKPQGYKVCCVCNNILESTLSKCPYCKAYRFEKDEKIVAGTAMDHLTKPSNALIFPRLYID